MIKLSIIDLIWLILIISFVSYVTARGFDYEKENQKLKLELKCIETFRSDRVK
jgi:hypothetical protein